MPIDAKRAQQLQAFEPRVGRNAPENGAVPSELSWERLLRHDAPRALGNVFIACLGATVMDGAQGVQEYSYLDAREVLVQHDKDCKAMVPNLT